MERNKRILLQALVLLSFLPILCSCVDKVVYTYEDIVITRYDYEGFMNGKPTYKSVFYCNKSDKKCKIEATGSQCYYTALLCIDRKTKKIWISSRDCYILQKEVDTLHFQAAMRKEIYDEINVKNYNTMGLAKKHEVLEENYECYALQGLGDYLKYEKKHSEEEFPNSKIEARYYYNIYERGVRW